jgi:hypothetical protein
MVGAETRDKEKPLVKIIDTTNYAQALVDSLPRSIYIQQSNGVIDIGTKDLFLGRVVFRDVYSPECDWFYPSVDVKPTVIDMFNKLKTALSVHLRYAPALATWNLCNTVHKSFSYSSQSKWYKDNVKVTQTCRVCGKTYNYCGTGAM